MSSSKNPILHTLLSLTGDPNTITVHRAVVDFLEGRFKAALLLEQLLYWTPKAAKRGGWIAKSYTEWQEEIFLTRYAVEKARKYLKSRGLVEWEVRRFNNSPTAFYRVNLDALAQAWEAFLGERGEVETLEDDVAEVETASEIQPETPEEAPAEIDRWSEEAKKAPAEISKCPEEPSKAPAEISKPPAEIDRSPAEISKSLTEITTEITQLTRKRKLTAATTATVNRGEPPRAPAAVAAAANLPDEIRDALKSLGWAGSMGEVAAAWQQNPARVRAWVEYAQRKRWSAALLRAVLREDPGYPPQEPDPAERYLGNYAPPDDAPETRPDAPSSPEPSPDLPASVRQWWQLAVMQLAAEMPKSAFDTWVRPTQLAAWETENGQGALTVTAANEYAQRWLTERVTKILERKLTGLAGHPVAVQFVVLEDAHA